MARRCVEPVGAILAVVLCAARAAAIDPNLEFLNLTPMAPTNFVSDSFERLSVATFTLRYSFMFIVVDKIYYHGLVCKIEYMYHWMRWVEKVNCLRVSYVQNTMHKEFLH